MTSSARARLSLSPARITSTSGTLGVAGGVARMTADDPQPTLAGPGVRGNERPEIETPVPAGTGQHLPQQGGVPGRQPHRRIVSDLARRRALHQRRLPS
jgi:hypothetical protein